MLPTPKASHDVHPHSESSYGPKEDVVASTSLPISDARDSSSPSATCVDERRGLSEKGQSISRNAAFTGRSTLGTYSCGVEYSLSPPGCSGYSSKESQGRSRLRSAMSGLRKRLFQAATETTSGALTSENLLEGDGDVNQEAIYCRICSFRRQLSEQEKSNYHWWDPGPPDCRRQRVQSGRRVCVNCGNSGASGHDVFSIGVIEC
ncbi:hypothetical protein MTO96_015777 [Rhipicephalus appendiculatus]